MVVRDRIIRVGESVVCAELDDEAVLLNLESGIYYGLDSTGTQIWRLLAEGIGEDELVDRLADEFDADPEGLRRDVEEFLGILSSKGLLSVSAK